MVTTLPLLALAAILSRSTVVGATPTFDPAGTATPSTLSDISDLKDAQEEYLNSVCAPNLSKFYAQSTEREYTNADSLALLKTFKTSPFPCEMYMYVDATCNNATYTTDSGWLHQAQCMCGNDALSLRAACQRCHGVHGADPEAVALELQVVSSVDMAFCSATAAPTAAYFDYWVTISREADKSFTYSTEYTGTMIRYVTGSDVAPNSTAVSYYYTDGAAATATTSSVVTGSAQTKVGSSTGAAAAATSTLTPGGAGQLKAVGGVVVALLGVMVAL